MTLDTALRHFPLLKQLPAHEGEPLIVAHGFDAGARVTAAAAALGAARTALAFMLGQPGLGGAGQRLERCGSSPAHYHRYCLSLARGPLPVIMVDDRWRHDRPDIVGALREKTVARLLKQTLEADRQVRAALAAGGSVAFSRLVTMAPGDFPRIEMRFDARSSLELEMSLPLAQLTTAAPACLLLRGIDLGRRSHHSNALGLIVGRDPSATLRAGRRLGGPERLRHHAAALSALTAMGLGELAGALAREANAPSKVVRNRAESPVTRTMSDIALLKNMFFAGGFQGRSKFWKPIPPGSEKE